MYSDCHVNISKIKIEIALKNCGIQLNFKFKEQRLHENIVHINCVVYNLYFLYSYFLHYMLFIYNLLI